VAKKRKASRRSKKASRKATRGASRRRAKTTKKKGAARGRKAVKKAARATRSGTRKRPVRKPKAGKPVSRKKIVAAGSGASAAVGEMYGEADWRADQEPGQGLRDLNRLENLPWKPTPEDKAKGAEPKAEEDSEW
jgi:hypothetical protein